MDFKGPREECSPRMRGMNLFLSEEEFDPGLCVPRYRG